MKLETKSESSASEISINRLKTSSKTIIRKMNLIRAWEFKRMMSSLLRKTFPPCWSPKIITLCNIVLVASLTVLLMAEIARSLVTINERKNLFSKAYILNKFNYKKKKIEKRKMDPNCPDRIRIMNRGPRQNNNHLHHHGKYLHRHRQW